MELILKKIPSPVKPGFGGFLSREKVSFLNENRGGGLTTTGLVFFLNYNRGGGLTPTDLVFTKAL
jgi:hypothetical protein